MTPEARERLRHQLIRHEGLRLFPYVDTVGKITIGVGRNLTDNGISHLEAGLLLDNDLNKAINQAIRHWPQWFMRLDATRQAAIVNIVFNLGPAKFGKFEKAILAIDAGDLVRARAELLDSKWAGQVGTRAVELADQLLTGKWGPE